MVWPVRTTTLGPIAAGSVVFRERGVTYVTAVAKATFALVHEGLALQVQASPLVGDDEPDALGDALHRPSEIAPFLPSVDVLLTGHARALHGVAVPAIATRLVIVDEDAGSPPRVLLDKTVHAYGERETTAAYPEEFALLELTYAHAARASRDSVAGASAGHAPRLVLPSGARGLASFGPIARHWPERAALIEHADLTWGPMGEGAAGDAPVGLTLSDDFPFAFFQAAPPEQRLAHVSGGVWLLVDGMHPDLPRFATKLPYTRAEAQLYDERGKPTPIPLHCDTLSIDMDDRTCTLLFRGHVPAPSDALSAFSIVATVEIGKAPVDEHAETPDGLTQVGPSATSDTRVASVASEASVAGEPSAPSTTPPERARKTVPPPTSVAEDQAMPFRAAPRPADTPAREPAPTGGLPFAPRKPAGLGLTLGDALRHAPPPTFDEAPAPALDRPASLALEETAPPKPYEARAPEQTAESAPPPPLAAELTPTAPSAPPPAPGPAAPVETGIRGEVLAKLGRGEAFYDANLAGADLSGIDFGKAAMSGANLTGAKLVGCSFDGARLGGAKLTGADLSRASLRGADLTGANLGKAVLAGASLEGAQLSDANLTSAAGAGARFDRATGQRATFAQGTWTGASFRELDIAVADFSGAELDEAAFDAAKLSGARFADARARGARFEGASLDQATFQGAHLDEVVFDGASLKSTAWERATIAGSTFARASLEKANLARAALTKASFDGADLQGATLIGATSSETSFVGASLTGADARQAKLSDTVFEKADLRRFNAHKASLVGCRFDEASLVGASLRGARLRGASFRGADLAEADLRDADLEGANLRDTKNRTSAKLGGANLRDVEE